MELTLIRHGESEANLSGRWQGQGDSPLSHTGREQAAALATRLRDHDVGYMLTSDLTRAKETGQALDRPLAVSPAWREIDVGSWEGLTREEVFLRFPADTAALKAGATDVPVGGGESWSQVRERALAALQALRKEGHGHACVVTHGGVIFSLVSALFNLPMVPPRPLGRIVNTALTTVRFGQHGCQLLRFNDQSHWSDPEVPEGRVMLLRQLEEQDATDDEQRRGQLERVRDEAELIDLLSHWTAGGEQELQLGGSLFAAYVARIAQCRPEAIRPAANATAQVCVKQDRLQLQWLRAPHARADKRGRHSI